MNKINNLTQEEFYTFLVEKSNEYYNTQSSSLSDSQFDKLVNLYETKFDEKFNYLGSRGKYKLPVYLGSLNKHKDDHSLSLFLKKCSDSFVISDKVDGLSMLVEISLDKNENIKMKMYTRGDGEYGNDISILQKYLDIKLNQEEIIEFMQEKELKKLYIRGEVVMMKDVFDIKYKEDFANSRNIVSGIINSKTKNEEMMRDLSFLAYNILNTDVVVKSFNIFSYLETFGFQTPVYIRVEKDFINMQSLTTYCNKRKEEADYEMDGLVISDMFVHSEKNGENPKYTIAFKTSSESVETEVEYIEWNVSKQHILKPRIKVKEITLSGATINYVTGFNGKFIKDNKIGKGTIINITRSGDVIPHINYVVKSTQADMPNQLYKWNESGVDIYCEEETGEQWIKKMIYFFEVKEIKGVKEGILTKLYEAGFDTEEKIFNITKRELMTVEGVKDKSAGNIYEGIQQLKNTIKLNDLMTVSCIFPNFGRKKIVKLMEDIPEIEEIITENKKYDGQKLLEKLSINGFHKTGEIFIEKLEEFKEYYNRVKDLFPNLTTVEINFVDSDEEDGMVEIEESGYKGEKYIFCFTGFRDKKMKEELERVGHTVSETVSKKINFCVVEDLESESGKVKKARDYGIEIIHKDDLKKYI
jgi:DNA ligase (NAD+)